MNIYRRLMLEKRIKSKITLDMSHEEVLALTLDETLKEIGTNYYPSAAGLVFDPQPPVKQWAHLTLPGKRGSARKKFKRIWWKKILGVSLFDFIFCMMDRYPKDCPCSIENILSHIELEARENGHDVLKIRNWHKKINSTHRWCKSKRRQK